VTSKRFVFDIEGNGLLDTVTKVHCLVAIDVDTREVYEFVGHDEIVNKGLPLLESASLLAGHNVCDYDFPALEKIFGWSYNGLIFDTLIAAKLFNPDMFPVDATRKYSMLAPKNFGSHSLEAWGQRLGELKQDKPVDFSVFTPEMLEYCKQDVVTNAALFRYLETRVDDGALRIETNFAINTAKMSKTGFPFDIAKAQDMHAKLAAERAVIQKELIALFPTRVIERVSEKTGKPLKPTIIEFNPSSRDHIAYWFKEKYQWSPKDFTPSGKPEVNADILAALPYPEAKELHRYFELDKVIGMLAEGKNAWLALVGKDGRMHGRVNTIGAATTRCTHSSPNMSQVPSTRAPFGKECRELFYAPKGFKQVGADLNAIELRVFAHYLSALDGGAYSNIIVSSDIHWANAVAAGFYPKTDKPYNEHDKDMKAARTNAKTLVYALLYSAGDSKLGQIVGGGAKEGKKIRSTLYKNFPAIEELITSVKGAAERNGSIKLIHGARIPVRKAFAALNTLLQGSAAVINKEWVNTAAVLCDKKGWIFGEDYWFAASIHDEIQSIVKEHLAEEFARIVEEAATIAGDKMGMRCPVQANALIGNNWYEVH